MRLADYIAVRCVEAGIRDVFLVTGGGAMHLNDGFSRQSALKVTCFHHEQAAAMAAEAYYRVTGRLALVNVTTGPGGINALNGVYGAHVDSMGMIIISGQVKRETYVGSYDIPLRQLGDQEVDIIKVASPLVKYGVTVYDPQDIGLVMDKALFLANSGRPGPCWIDVPVDVQAVEIDVNSIPRWNGSTSIIDEDPNVSTNTKIALKKARCYDQLENDLGKILDRLRAAHRPVWFLGNGVRLAGIVDRVLACADRLGIPLVTGWNAHDILPNSHPCYVGRPGSVGDRPGNFAVQNSDYLLVLGSRLNIRQVSYNYHSFASRAWKAIVDIDWSELQKPTIHFDLKVCADLTTFWSAFETRVERLQKEDEHTKYLAWCLERNKRYPTVLNEYRHHRTPINPYYFIETLFDMLPEGAKIATGNGSACVIGFQAANIKKGQRLFTNSGSASMGYDLPAAIGSAIANGGETTYCLAGDGSVMMNIQELQTIVHNKLPIKIFILNNDGYASIRQTQMNYFPDNQIGNGPDNGISFPNFSLLASSFGIEVERIETIENLKSEKVKDLIGNKKPVIFDVIIDPSQGFAPKLTSRRLIDGTLVSPPLEDMFPFLDRSEFKSNIIE